MGTYSELNENESTAHANLWDAAKTVLKDTSLTLNASVRKENWSQVNALTSTSLEKGATVIESEQKEENNNKRKSIKLETEKTMKKINKTKSQFLEKINKIDKSLGRLTKIKERRHTLPILGMKEKASQKILEALKG